VFADAHKGSRSFYAAALPLVICQIFSGVVGMSMWSMS
jgi:hypothetical protein